MVIWLVAMLLGDNWQRLSGSQGYPMLGANFLGAQLPGAGNLGI